LVTGGLQDRTQIGVVIRGVTVKTAENMATSATTMGTATAKLGGPAMVPPRKRVRVVTRREEEVLQLIADGCSTVEVAKSLSISQKTVKNHLTSIYQKLDARDRTQAMLQALRLGIVTLD